jgi:hypothetical protein
MWQGEAVTHKYIEYESRHWVPNPAAIEDSVKYSFEQ